MSKFEGLLGSNYIPLTEYLGVRKPIELKCIKHDQVFTALPSTCNTWNRIVGCKECRHDLVTSKSRNKFGELLLKSGGFVLLADYINTATKVKIKCLAHNTIFKAHPGSCLTYRRIYGCKKCHGSRISKANGGKVSDKTREKFESLLDKDYILIEKYKNATTLIKTKCLIHNTEFLSLPAKCNYAGYIKGCLQCGYLRQSANIKGVFIDEAKEKFRSLLGYKYKLIHYSGTQIKQTKVKCLEHGNVFLVRPNDCIRYSRIMGCSKCSFLRYSKSRKGNLKQEVKSKFLSILKFRKEFKLFGRYKGTFYNIDTFCKKHKQFFSLNPGSVLRYGYIAGCSKCKGVSIPERQILEYVEKLIGKEKVIHQPMWRDAPGNTGIIKPDIVIPHLKLVIEHNGLYYGHSAVTDSKEDNKWKHHKRRQRIEKLGYRVIYIWGDDWIKRTQAIKCFFKALLRPDLLQVWDARKLKIKSVSSKFANLFFDKYHPQGKTYGGQQYIGLFDHLIKKTVAVIGFSTASRPIINRKNTVELTRYASRGRVRGGASRLLTHFIRQNPDIETVISFSDNDYFDGGMYPAIGFKFAGEVAPDYSTIWNWHTRRHKSYTKRANLVKLARQGIIEFDPATMTEKSCLAHNGIRRCWNSGKKRWILTCNQPT